MSTGRKSTGAFLRKKSGTPRLLKKSCSRPRLGGEIPRARVPVPHEKVSQALFNSMAFNSSAPLRQMKRSKTDPFSIPGKEPKKRNVTISVRLAARGPAMHRVSLFEQHTSLLAVGLRTNACVERLNGKALVVRAAGGSQARPVEGENGQSEMLLPPSLCREAARRILYASRH